MGRGSADRTKSGVEWRLLKFSNGAFAGERKSGRVWRRSLLRGSQSRPVLRDGGNLTVGISKGTPFDAGPGRREARSVILLGISEAVSVVERCTIRPRRGQGVDQRMVQKRNAAAAHESSQVGLHLGSASLIKMQGGVRDGGIAFLSVSRDGGGGSPKPLRRKRKRRFGALRRISGERLLRFGRTSIGWRGV